MNNILTIIFTFGLAFIIFSVGVSCGASVAEKTAKQNFEQNAVKAGAAVWLHDKDTGAPVIKWINTPLSKEEIEGR